MLHNTNIVILFHLNLISHFPSDNYHVGQSTVSFSMPWDFPIPTKCSSPGWKSTPYDTSTVSGSFIHYSCRSSIPHRQTLWLCRGQQIDKISSLADRIKIYNGNTSLRFGPVKADDHGLVIGCEVKTNYGPLPSKTGKIRVMSELAVIIDSELTNFESHSTLIRLM